MSEMKRCEREWSPEKAAGVQAMVRELCGRCLCESGERCPLFSYQTAVVEEDAQESSAA